MLLRPRELLLGGGGGFGLFFSPVALLCCVEGEVALCGFSEIIAGMFSFLSMEGLESPGCLSVPFFLHFLGGGTGGDEGFVGASLSSLIFSSNAKAFCFTLILVGAEDETLPS